MNTVQKFNYYEIEGFEMGFAPMGRPMMKVVMYLLDAVLIDTCQSNMAGQAVSVLERRRINKILITHHHEDHSGNAARLSQIHKAPVMGHPLTVEKMKKSSKICPYQHIIWGRSQNCTVLPLPRTVETSKFTLTPVHTPGHSRDHTVFLEKNRGWLFSGDLYLGKTIKYFRSDEVMEHQIASLKKILVYDFDTLLCAHHPVLQNGKSALRSKLNFLEDLQGNIQRLHRKGLETKEICSRLRFSSDRGVRWFTLGNVSFFNMIRSSLNSR